MVVCLFLLPCAPSVRPLSIRRRLNGAVCLFCLVEINHVRRLLDRRLNGAAYMAPHIRRRFFARRLIDK